MDVSEFIKRTKPEIKKKTLSHTYRQTYAYIMQILAEGDSDVRAICSCVPTQETRTSPPRNSEQSSSLHPLYFWQTQHVLDSVIKLLQNKTPPHQKGLIKSSIYLSVVLDK